MLRRYAVSAVAVLDKGNFQILNRHLVFAADAASALELGQHVAESLYPRLADRIGTSVSYLNSGTEAPTS